MTFDTRTLTELLPAVYRLRDAELAGKIPSVQGPLSSLLAVFAEQIAVLEENLEQLYDDQFIETCAPWVVPYIGDLIGYRVLHGKAPGIGGRRAEVAHTIAFRRRKGTASMLEQLARDVTGWNARVVEYFQLLATTQYMNHVRLAHHSTPSLRRGDALEWLGSAFDPVPHTLDVRRIASRRGRYNVPNVGIFLWSIDAHRLARSPATPNSPDPGERRFRFSALGNDTPLYTRPDAEDEITHLAEPINVPAPISRRMLHRHLARYYGEGKSVLVYFDDAPQPLDRIDVCNLADDGADWAHDAPAGRIAIDPELGRLVVAADLALPDELRVTSHYGALGDLGGGEYPRLESFESPEGEVALVPGEFATVQDAIDSLGGAGVVEIGNNGRYAESIQIDVAAGRTIEVRAASGRRPTLELTQPMILRGGAGAAVVLDGLMIAGDTLEVPTAANSLRRLRLAHTTLVPGRRLRTDGAPDQPGATSLVIARADVVLQLERSIVGAIWIHAGSTASITDSVIDAGIGGIAYATPDGASAGGELTVESSTVVGGTRCVLAHISNSVLLGRLDVERRQEGCMRFSFAPAESRAPRRFRCQPEAGDETGSFPRFTSLRYSVPGYCQLTARTPDAIRRGSEDESEMGVFRHLYRAQRESDLRTRLDEYLRVGLQAGIFYES